VYFSCADTDRPTAKTNNNANKQTAHLLILLIGILQRLVAGGEWPVARVTHRVAGRNNPLSILTV